jgi:hypothetical protein
MLVELTGSDMKPYIAKFRKDHFRGVRKIRIKVAPPMLRNQAGRWQLFTQIKDLPEQQKAEAIDIITTGNYRPVASEEGAESALIDNENERLAAGTKCPVYWWHNPETHMPCHRKLIDQLSVDPEGNAQQLQIAVAHLQEHIDVWLGADPSSCAFLGIQPPPQPDQGMPAPPPQDGNGKPAPAGKGAPADDGRPRSALGPKVPAPAKPPEGAEVAA